MKPCLDVVIPSKHPDREDSKLTDTEFDAVVKMTGGEMSAEEAEKCPFLSTPGRTTTEHPTMIEYSVFGSNPLTIS